MVKRLHREKSLGSEGVGCSAGFVQFSLRADNRGAVRAEIEKTKASRGGKYMERVSHREPTRRSGNIVCTPSGVRSAAETDFGAFSP